MSNPILRSLLDKTATHKRATYSADASGARSPTYATQTAGVKVAVWPMGANAAIAAAFDRQDILTDCVLATDRDIGVKADDLIVVGSDSYLVAGAMKYENFGVMNATVYLIAADLRIV